MQLIIQFEYPVQYAKDEDIYCPIKKSKCLDKQQFCNHCYLKQFYESRNTLSVEERSKEEAKG